MTLTIDINNPQQQCNLACEFCYSWDLEGQLCLDNVKRIVSENSCHGVVELGGGEPLLHKEISDIVAYLTLKAGKQVHVSTNGTYVPESLCMLSEQARRKTCVQVSLHASNKQLFGEITGKPGLFERVVQNVRMFKEYFSTTVNTVVYEKNIGDVSGIIRLVKELGVPHRVMLVMPVGRGKNVRLLSSEQIADLTSYLLAEKASGAMIDSPLLRPNGCPALAHAYGIPKTGKCPLEHRGKLYVNPVGTKRCEFYA